MKKFIVLLMVLALVLALLTACGGSGKGIGGGKNNSSGGTPAGVLNASGEDPCDCCPDCDQDNCKYECTECKCCTGGGGDPGSYTYVVKFYAYVAGWRPIHKTFGEATVTMDLVDGSYFGSAPGAGDYQEEYIPETGQVETTFDFTAQLKDYDPKVRDSITVGLNRIGAKEVTNYAKSEPADKVKLPDMGNVILMILGKDYIDPASDPMDMDTWLYNFVVPMEDGIGYKIFNLDRADQEFEGHLELTIQVDPK